MPNRLVLSNYGNASEFYESLDWGDKASLASALQYIEDFPFEHANTVTRRYMPPVMIYFFHDDDWRISYSLDKTPGELGFTIHVFQIDRAQGYH